MKPIFLFISAFLFVKCHSQKTIIYGFPGILNNNASEIIQTQNIKSDSVYYYAKRKNNKDSNLAMTQYFDSLGNLIERDEYNFQGEPYRITNYVYTGTVLLEQESLSKGFVNSSNISRKVITYDHDSSGNIIAEKQYDFIGDSQKTPSTTILNREYDSLKHLIKEFIVLPSGKSYLYHTYNYRNGDLAEMKSYEMNESWMYSYLYEYDETQRTKSVYLYNTSKNLKQELFYDEQKKLIMQKNYETHIFYLDHTTQAYFYDHNGLLESQTYQSSKGENYYYKHYYHKYSQ